jgi:hypothetical protein
MIRGVGFLAILLISSEVRLLPNPGKCNVPQAWSEQEICRILQDSSWVHRRAVRILERPKDMFGIPSETINSYLTWVHFTWLSEPVRQAAERAVNLSPQSFNTDLNQFLTAYRQLPSRGRGDGLPFYKESISILVTGSVLPDIIKDNKRAVEDTFMRTSDGRSIKACEVLYGINRLLYRPSDQGGSHARVRVEDLKQNRKRGWNVAKVPPAVLVFEDQFPHNYDVICILLVFPRQVKGSPILTRHDRNVTLEVPLGKKSLIGEFNLKNMVCADRLEF